MFCQNCGKRNKDSANFCYNCGSSLKIEDDDLSELDEDWYNDEGEDSLAFEADEFDPRTFSLNLKNAEARRSYYENKAKKGDVEAIYVMANLCYFNFEEQKALDYYSKICNRYPSLYKEMGFIYKDMRNNNAAFECFEKGAEHEDVDSIYWLGSCYLYGKGTKKNIDKAIEFFDDASEKGGGSAMVHLGELYEEGDIVDQDDTLAFIYYKKACRVETSHKESHYRLGLCYYNGIGTKVNEKLGVKYMREAAESGNRYAERWMNENGYEFEENE